MSLISSKETVGETGVKKTIDEKSMGIALEVLQSSMYQYPIKSTVREVTSNAVDSVKEREIAKHILSGKAKVSDYYQEQEGDIYHSSAFDKSYYDLNHLSSNNDVILHYVEKGPSEKDYFSVKDNGVGLGGDRLESFFTLNFSSKRLTKNLLGSFGLGSKSPLSTQVDSFRMVSVYNGQRYIFDIYLDRIESVVPKFGEAGLNTVNNFKKTNYEFYSESTDEKNGVEIIVETKKHHRREYVHAVKSQLLYFKNLKFKYTYEGRTSPSDISLNSEIIYEDKDILISNNAEYDKPHIILGTDTTQVVYGAVDFAELELEQRNGAIGLKMNLSEIAVTPSRESVIWNTKTRAAVIEKFNKVQNTAANFIQDSLKNEKDFLSWVRQVNKILNKNSSQYNYNTGHYDIDKKAGTIGILSQIIDASKIEIKFNGDKSIKFIRDVKKFFGDAASMRTITKQYYNDKIERTELNSWNAFDLPIYLTTDKVSSIKDAYIKSKLEGGNDFLLIKVNDEATNVRGVKALELILKSATVKDYDGIIIPEDVEEELANGTVVELSPAEKRKLNNQIVFFGVTKDYANNYKLVKKEKTVKELEDYKCQIVYGNKADVENIKLIQTCLDGAGVSFDLNSPDYIYPIQVSKSNLKHFKGLENAININKFLYNNVKNGTLVLPKTIANYLYARKVKSNIMIDFKFLNKFKAIDKEAYDKYQKLSTAIDAQYASYLSSDAIEAFNRFFNSVLDLQIEYGKDDKIDLISKLKEIYPEGDFDEVKTVKVIDFNDIYNSVEDLKVFSKPIKTMLNAINPLVSDYTTSKLDVELIKDIKAFIALKTK